MHTRHITALLVLLRQCRTLILISILSFCLTFDMVEAFLAHLTNQVRFFNAFDRSQHPTLSSRLEIAFSFPPSTAATNFSPSTLHELPNSCHTMMVPTLSLWPLLTTVPIL